MNLENINNDSDTNCATTPWASEVTSTEPILVAETNCAFSSRISILKSTMIPIVVFLDLEATGFTAPIRIT